MIKPYMGIIHNHNALWSALFTRTQRQLLGLLFGFPGKSYYANEIVRLARVGTGSVQRELARLAACGLVTVRQVGNQKHYQANAAHVIYPELCAIVRKTFGMLDQLRVALHRLDADMALAIVHGEALDAAEAGRSPLDLLVVSDQLTYVQLVGGLIEAESQIGRYFRPQVITTAEYAELANDPGSALNAILAAPHQVVGSIHAVAGR